MKNKIAIVDISELILDLPETVDMTMKSVTVNFDGSIPKVDYLTPPVIFDILKWNKLKTEKEKLLNFYFSKIFTKRPFGFRRIQIDLDGVVFSQGILNLVPKIKRLSRYEKRYITQYVRPKEIEQINKLNKRFNRVGYLKRSNSDAHLIVITINGLYYFNQSQLDQYLASHPKVEIYIK